jgi:hypothetical protein
MATDGWPRICAYVAGATGSDVCITCESVMGCAGGPSNSASTTSVSSARLFPLW